MAVQLNHGPCDPSLIVNSSISRLLKDVPTLSTDWQAQLRSWLVTILQEDFPPVFAAQREMLESIIQVEEEIQKLRLQRADLKRLLHQFKVGNQMPRVIDTQSEVSKVEEKIESLRYQRETVLFVGDVIALKLLDQDTIKHFFGHPSPGFISGKSGLQAEIEAAVDFFEHGYMVLFNDLTHSLPLGDLTLRKGGEVRTFEVKTDLRAYRTKEARRQIETPAVIHEWMKKDVTPVPVALPTKTITEMGFDPKKKSGYGHAIRLDSDIVEQVHFDVARTVFKNVYKSPVVRLDRGAKRYLACCKSYVAELKLQLEEMIRSGDWVVSNIRTRVMEHFDVPPFGLYFKPESTVDVVSGEAIIVSAFSIEDLTQQLKDKNITLKWKQRDSDLFPMEFQTDYQLDGEFEVGTKNICQWHWLRVLYSFLSVETFVERCAETLSPEALARFAAKIKEIRAKKMM